MRSIDGRSDVCSSDLDEHDGADDDGQKWQAAEGGECGLDLSCVVGHLRGVAAVLRCSHLVQREDQFHADTAHCECPDGAEHADPDVLERRSEELEGRGDPFEWVLRLRRVLRSEEHTSELQSLMST